MYYIKLKDKDLYLNINTKINDQFYCINVTLSKLPYLWLYNQDDKIITNYQTKGNIIHKYNGWIPETSNIILPQWILLASIDLSIQNHIICFWRNINQNASLDNGLLPSILQYQILRLLIRIN